MGWWSRLHIVDKAGFILFAAFLITKALFWMLQERFDQELWKEQPMQRYKMVDHLIEQELLSQTSVNAVIEILGQPDETKTIGNDVFIYRLGVPPSFSKLEEEQLLVIFIENKVAYVVIAN